MKTASVRSGEKNRITFIDLNDNRHEIIAPVELELPIQETLLIDGTRLAKYIGTQDIPIYKEVDSTNSTVKP